MAQGSAEALRDAAVLLSTETVAVRVASLGVGPVTQADIASAKAFGARIVAFNVAFETAAVSTRAKQIDVPVLCQPVIYRLIEARSLLLSDLLLLKHCWSGCQPCMIVRREAMMREPTRTGCSEVPADDSSSDHPVTWRACSLAHVHIQQKAMTSLL